MILFLQVRPSVRLSSTCLGEWWTNRHAFWHSGSDIILVMYKSHHHYKIPVGTPWVWSLNTQFWGKFAVFCHLSLNGMSLARGHRQPISPCQFQWPLKVECKESNFPVDFVITPMPFYLLKVTIFGTLTQGKELNSVGQSCPHPRGQGCSIPKILGPAYLRPYSFT